jgi:type II secretory pathway component PulF
MSDTHLPTGITQKISHFFSTIFDKEWNAANKFRKHRADYFEYLAAIMEGANGKKTLRDIFDDDAHRYGQKHYRGILSERWSRRYQECGGDLAETFTGALPQDDIVMIRAAQRAGAGALETSLLDLASVTRLIDQAKGIFISTIWVALVAILVMIATIVAIPFYTIPALMKSFSMVPVEYYGNTTRALLEFSTIIKSNLLIIAFLTFAVTYLLYWSLPNLTGPFRKKLDAWLIWRLYRDFQGIKFMATLATMVRQRGNVSTQLRDALVSQLEGSPWKIWHVNQMVERIDEGVVGPETFDTGIIDRETHFFLTDMIITNGMDQGLQRARSRIEGRTLLDVAKKATTLRWILLGVAVLIIMGVTLWHYAVITELTDSMSNYYSSSN